LRLAVTDAGSLPFRGSSRLPPTVRSIYAAILVFSAYYAGAKLGLALTLSPNPISVLWPPNATLLAALLIAPYSLWPLLLFAALPAHLLAELQGGVPPIMVLCWFVSNVSEALIGAVCARRLVGDRLKLDSVREVGIFLVCAAFLAPFISSFIDAGFVTLIGWGTSSYGALWKTRFFSNVLATLTIVPAIATFGTAGLTALREWRVSRISEGALLASGLLLACVVAFDIDVTTPGVPSALLYVPLPFLFWAALRFGPLGSSLAFAAVAFLAIWGAAHGHGPFSSIPPGDSAHAMQLFLTFIAVTFLALAAFVEERRKSEAQLRSSEERFATAFHSSPDAMAISRKADGRFIEVNERWLAMFGHDREDVLGRTVDDLNLFGDPTARNKAYALAGDRSGVREFEVDLLTSSGELLHGRVATRAVEMEGERRFVTIIRDDTERRRADVAHQELAHVTRISMMGELAASLAHELSQPLTAVISNVQAAQRFMSKGPMDTDELRAIVDDIARAGNRAGEVIHRMRSLARKGEFEVVPLDLSNVIQEVGALVQTDTIARGVHLSIAADGALPVRGDKVQLQQVMLNLLLNAFDAVKELPASEREVAVRAERDRDTVCVRVSDRGPGFSPENLQKLFTPFFTSKRDGMGLGLSISRSIIEAHGGQLIAANNSFRGATFEFALPLDDRPDKTPSG
jgi:two-component system sensor kinase FixL